MFPRALALVAVAALLSRALEAAVYPTPQPTILDTVLEVVSFDATVSAKTNAGRLDALHTTLAATLDVDGSQITALTVTTTAVTAQGLKTGFYTWSVDFSAYGSPAALGEASMASWATTIEGDLTSPAFSASFISEAGVDSFIVTPGTVSAAPERRAVPSHRPTTTPSPTTPSPTTAITRAIQVELMMVASAKLSDDRAKVKQSIA